MFLDKHILIYFEFGFMKNLSIFEPQIEKDYAYENTCLLAKSNDEVGSIEGNIDLERARCIFSYY